jgi:hypothetical protein
LFDDSVRGWAFFDSSDEIPTVMLELNGEVIASAPANQPRQDITRLGLHETGRCGFEFTQLKNRQSRTCGNITIRIEQTGATLHLRDERAPMEFDDVPEDYRPLVFLHIPKTAGTSFRHAAERYFGPASVARDYGDGNPATSPLIQGTVFANRSTNLLPALSDQGIKVLCGHFRAATYMGLLGKHARWCTFLRDPVQRVISEYKHVVRHRGYAETLRHFSQQAGQCNKQSRWLKGLPLDEAFFVGITEHLDESIREFNKRAGVKLPCLEENMSRATVSETHEVPDDLLDLIRSNNAKDFEIYERFTAARADKR